MLRITVPDINEDHQRRQYVCKNDRLTLPRSVLHRMIREIVDDVRFHQIVTHDATHILQQAAEQFIINAFVRAGALARDAGRETLFCGDLRMAVRDPGSLIDGYELLRRAVHQRVNRQWSITRHHRLTDEPFRAAVRGLLSLVLHPSAGDLTWGTLPPEIIELVIRCWWDVEA